MPPVIRKSDSSSDAERHTVLHSLGWQIQVKSNTWSPPTDMYETDDEYVVRVEIAGMKESGFNVSIEDHFLVISGIRPDVLERRAYHQMEIRFGKFFTAVGLPGPVNLDASVADYDNGFLTVTLPKAQPNQIEIEHSE